VHWYTITKEFIDKKYHHIKLETGRGYSDEYKNK